MTPKRLRAVCPASSTRMWRPSALILAAKAGSSKAATSCQEPPASSTTAFKRAVFGSACGVQLYTVSWTLRMRERWVTW